MIPRSTGTTAGVGQGARQLGCRRRRAGNLRTAARRAAIASAYALGIVVAAIGARAEDAAPQTSPQATNHDGEGLHHAASVLEICVDSRAYAAARIQRECVLLDRQFTHDLRAMDDLSASSAPVGLIGAYRVTLGPDEGSDDVSFAEGYRDRLEERYRDDWRYHVPDAALWLVAYKSSRAGAAFRSREELFLGDDLRHRKHTSTGIAARDPSTARSGAPLESVGLRLQIAY